MHGVFCGTTQRRCVTFFANWLNLTKAATDLGGSIGNPFRRLRVHTAQMWIEALLSYKWNISHDWECISCIWGVPLGANVIVYVRVSVREAPTSNVSPCKCTCSQTSCEFFYYEILQTIHLVTGKWWKIREDQKCIRNGLSSMDSSKVTAAM